jgi:hypothetical protein
MLIVIMYVLDDNIDEVFLYRLLFFAEVIIFVILFVMLVIS